jgi:synaptobrevin family protein YKT6
MYLDANGDRIQGYDIHAYGRTEGICGIIISDQEYPKLVAQQILSKVCDEFLAKYPRSAFTSAAANSLPYPELKDYIVKYQDPGQADSIMKIQKELDETKIVLHKTIESVLERGEKIDSLVAKSDGLSAQSKMFYTQVCLALLGQQKYERQLTNNPPGEEAELLLCCHVNMPALSAVLLGVP